METESISILENPHAMRLLIFINNNPGFLRSEIYESVPGAKKTLQHRIDELVKQGLLKEEESKTHKRGRFLYITDKGYQISKCAMKMTNILDGLDCEGDPPIDYGTSSTEQNMVK